MHFDVGIAPLTGQCLHEVQVGHQVPGLRRLGDSRHLQPRFRCTRKRCGTWKPATWPRTLPRHGKRGSTACWTIMPCASHCRQCPEAVFSDQNAGTTGPKIGRSPFRSIWEKYARRKPNGSAGHANRDPESASRGHRPPSKHRAGRGRAFWAYTINRTWRPIASNRSWRTRRIRVLAAVDRRRP